MGLPVRDVTGDHGGGWESGLHDFFKDRQDINALN